MGGFIIGIISFVVFFFLIDLFAGTIYTIFDIIWSILSSRTFWIIVVIVAVLILVIHHYSHRDDH